LTKHIRNAAAIVIVLLASLVGTAAAGAQTIPPPTFGTLENLTYTLPNAGNIPLTGGVYTNSAANLDVRYFTGYIGGDLDGDNTDGDAAVILVANTGGTGQFYYLVAVTNEPDVPRQRGQAYYLGDRIDISNLVITNGTIVLNYVTQAANDPLCCPSRAVTTTFALNAGQLQAVSGYTPGVTSAPGVNIGTGGVFIVEFDPGETSATLDGFLPQNGATVYRVTARAGQQMTVNLIVRGSPSEYPTLSITDKTSGRILYQQPPLSGPVGASLANTGDYDIRLQGSRFESIQYTLIISIPPQSTAPPPVQGGAVQLVFDAGATEKTVDSFVPAGSIDRYRVQAQAGQTMNIRLFLPTDTSIGTAGEPVLGVLDLTSGRSLVRPSQGLQNASVSLPNTGQYEIAITATNDPNGETYSLTVSIPTGGSAPTTVVNQQGSITIAAGNTSATRSGYVTANATDVYTINLNSGETLSASLTGGQGPVLGIIGPGNNVLLDPGNRRTAFAVQAPSTGTYRVSVGSSPAGRQYTLRVSVLEASGASTYVVQPGDTIGTIAQRFGVTPQAISNRNGLSDPNSIFVGQTLIIP